jgi:hypothetical protein
MSREDFKKFLFGHPDTRSALDSFVEFLESAAVAATSLDEPLSKKLTEKERALLLRQLDFLLDSVESLKKIIAAHPDHELGYYSLWSALGSAVVIGRHTTIDPFKERLDKDKMITVRARKPKPAKDIDRIIVEWFELASGKNPHLSNNAIAKNMAPEFNKRHRLKLKRPLTPGAIRKRYERMTKSAAQK